MRAYPTAPYIDSLGSGWAEATVTTCQQSLLTSFFLAHGGGGKGGGSFEDPASLLLGLFPQQLITINIKDPAGLLRL